MFTELRSVHEGRLDTGNLVCNISPFKLFPSSRLKEFVKLRNLDELSRRTN